MYKISKAENNDFNLIVEIGKNSLPIYYNVDDLVMLKATKHIIFKIESNNNICGFMVCRETEKNIHILSIAVTKEFRKYGLGTELINEIKNKNKSISLYVHTVNEVGINFYKKNNFKIKDILFGYYDNFDIDKDAYKMIYLPQNLES